jgi:hypothetical protein
MENIWLIPVIAVVVWVIAAVARAAKAKEQQAQRAEPMAQQPPRRRPTSTEIDRFLEEVKRRQMEQRRRREQPAEAVLEAEPVVIAHTLQPEPPPVRRQPSRKRHAEPIRPVAVVEAIPVALPAEPASSVVAQPIAPPVIESKISKAQAAQMAELRKMLRSPEGLRTALLAQIILSPPASRRRR